MKIPLVDLSLQHREISDEVARGMAEVAAEGSFILGPAVAQFEREFAEYCGVRHCVGVANGSDALELILRAAGIGAGHEVVLPANTFIATALAVARCGATPVLVDCDADYQLIDLAAAAAAIGSATRAIIGVDLFGQAAPLAALEALAEERGVLLLEDAAQAQGARAGGRCAGSFGAAAGTSFYPAKNLGAYGDGGAVLTQSDELAEQVRQLRNYGSDRKYHHPQLGFNSRLDSLQAVVLSAKLKRLPAWNAERARAAAYYDEALSAVAGVQLPATAPGNDHVWHLYVVRVAARDRVLAELHAADIGAGVHYPVPIHLQGAFSHLGYVSGAFPEAERAALEILSLPLYPGIEKAQQDRVVAVLRGALVD
jgi:dTDP-4-amino-4,6-dideoxygalactose transaminase